jgi:hypothetical protein
MVLLALGLLRLCAHLRGIGDDRVKACGGGHICRSAHSNLSSVPIPIVVRSRVTTDETAERRC